MDEMFGDAYRLKRCELHKSSDSDPSTLPMPTPTRFGCGCPPATCTTILTVSFTGHDVSAPIDGASDLASLSEDEIKQRRKVRLPVWRRVIDFSCTVHEGAPPTPVDGVRTVFACPDWKGNHGHHAFERDERVFQAVTLAALEAIFPSHAPVVAQVLQFSTLVIRDVCLACDQRRADPMDEDGAAEKVDFALETMLTVALNYALHPLIASHRTPQTILGAIRNLTARKTDV